jgi:hypothetical protein
MVLHLDSNMVLVKPYNLEESGCDKAESTASPKYVTLPLNIDRSLNFRGFSVGLLTIDIPESLKYEVQETESTLLQL